MANNNWSGQPNGYIDYAKMNQVFAPVAPGGPEVGTGKYLQPDAANALMNLIRSANKAGFRFYINPAEDLYRDFARQQYWKNYWTKLGKPGNAATPGQSNHGWGLAADVQGWGDPGAWVWLTFNAPKFNYQLLTVPTERWHWLYIGPTTTTASSQYTPIPTEVPKEEETEMKSILIEFTRKGDASLHRALFTPGTAYYLEWSGDSGPIAQGFANSLTTGNSVPVTESMADAIKAAALAV